MQAQNSKFPYFPEHSWKLESSGKVLGWTSSTQDCEGEGRGGRGDRNMDRSLKITLSTVFGLPFSYLSKGFKAFWEASRS